MMKKRGIAIKNLKTLYVKDKITEEEIHDLVELSLDATVIIEPPKYENNDEPRYFANLKRIFAVIKTHSRTYNIKVKVENRELFKQFDLLNYPNINLIINSDQYNYQKEEYLKEEEQLERMIAPIKESKLSPYEKYLATYNIVKQFKPYRENYNNPSEARYLKYILENEYIVCLGFSKLLTTLLDKVGIPTLSIDVMVDASYNQNLPRILEGHERNLVKIDDDKYNIHGIFVSDPTWDNSVESDFYVHSSMTFERMKESKSLEKMSDIDLLLDFHDFSEFLDKINFYIKRKINKKYYSRYLQNITYVYITLYNNIMDILLKLDYQEYQKLYKKYNAKLERKIHIYTLRENVTLLEVEKIFSEFLTEYAEYIIPLANQKIEIKTLLQAATRTKEVVEKYSPEELNEWQTKVINLNTFTENKLFPYIYDYKEQRNNYLKVRKK